MLDRHGQSLEQELEREREIVARVRAEAVMLNPKSGRVSPRRSPQYPMWARQRMADR